MERTTPCNALLLIVLKPSFVQLIVNPVLFRRERPWPRAPSSEQLTLFSVQEPRQARLCTRPHDPQVLVRALQTLLPAQE